ncbi:Nucleoid-associated protein NdpA [Klebsiella pneumoniae]|nr:Nucleoid-associated protein NdpA [Klebsiella pneumoniae]
MSLDIDQIALHQLIKRDEQNLELVLRESLLEPNATVVEMMAELHRVYSAKSKAYGLFNEESELAQALRLQRQGEEEFLAFSRAATGRLRDELAKYPVRRRRHCPLLPVSLPCGRVSAGGGTQ